MMSTSVLICGSSSPRRTRLNRASEDGRVLVGSDLIVEAVRQLRFERTPINDVDECVDLRQLVAAAHASQQGFRGWTRLGRIRSDRRGRTAAAFRANTN